MLLQHARQRRTQAAEQPSNAAAPGNKCSLLMACGRLGFSKFFKAVSSGYLLLGARRFNRRSFTTILWSKIACCSARAKLGS